MSDDDIPHTNRNLLREESPDIVNQYESVSIIAISDQTNNANDVPLIPSNTGSKVFTPPVKIEHTINKEQNTKLDDRTNMDVDLTASNKLSRKESEESKNAAVNH